jgi:hypothetical protein
MPTETRTEYAVKSTETRHGKRQVVIETTPGHESDRAWNEERAEGEREWQASVGLTPDATLVTRTVTVTEWTDASAPNETADDAEETPMGAGTYRLCERGGLGGGEGSLPFLHLEQEMALPEVLNLASVLSGNLGGGIDVMDGDTYLVSYCGGSPYWWLPGTHGEISSRGWCHDCCKEGDDFVHHLAREVEVGVLTREALHDPVFRKRLAERGQTAEEYAQMVAGNALPLER